jgi:hypothetical protein
LCEYTMFVYPFTVTHGHLSCFLLVIFLSRDVAGTCALDSHSLSFL